MDMERGSEADKPRNARKLLRAKLDSSIEAHRLRLQKARGLKSAKAGQLCECQKCDMTSMKPSMRCLKESTQQTKTEPKAEGGSKLKPVVSSATQGTVEKRRSSQRHVYVDKPILSSSVPPFEDTPLVERKKGGHTFIRAQEGSSAMRKHQHFAEPYKAFDITDSSVTRSNSGATNGVYAFSSDRNTSDRDTLSLRDLTAKALVDEILSSLSKRSSGRSSRSGKNGNIADEGGTYSRPMGKKPESIHVLDAYGDSHRLNKAEVEERVYSLINQLIQERLSRDKTGRSDKNAEETPKAGRGKCYGSLKCCDSYPTTNTYDVVSQLSLDATKSFSTLPSEGHSRTNFTDLHEAEDIDKYKNVVDVLLDYIVTSRSEKPKSTSSSRSEVCDVQETNEKPSATVSTEVTDSKPIEPESCRASRANGFCGVGLRGFMCCNRVEPENVEPKKEEVSKDNKVENGTKKDSVATENDKVCDKKVAPTPSSRKMTSSFTQSYPTNTYMGPAPQTMGNYMIYGQMGTQHYMTPYVVQTPYVTQGYAYNPMMYPTVNYGATASTDRAYGMPAMQQPSVRQATGPFSRTQSMKRMQQRTASLCSSTARAQTTFASAPKSFPRTYTGGMPRKPSNMYAFNTGPTTTPTRQVLGQQTGPVYRRNTGRAYLRQVQAAMI
ncbi:hypothetical protein BgAZ_102250 [Babesia gibsoni]|uniref:Uncharacterized protein n=1 Tax=Babesia gibsoni TaxID=33632 RepID=A0AAD8PFD7_BABGI|nr:hypothetical protein BgAZ_102250 [Babesia gibsoni]